MDIGWVMICNNCAGWCQEGAGQLRQPGEEGQDESAAAGGADEEVAWHCDVRRLQVCRHGEPSDVHMPHSSVLHPLKRPDHHPCRLMSLLLPRFASIQH